jgi:replicative DNA helicase
MDEREFPFSEDFQRSLLKLMGVDDAFAAKCCVFLKEKYFNNEYLSWLFRVMKDYYAEYKKTPSIQTLENEARKESIKDQPTYLETIRRVFGMEILDPEYVRRELTGFVRRNIFAEAHVEGAKLFNRHSNESAYDFTKRKMDELLGIDFDKEDIVDFANVEKYLDDAAHSGENSVPTGITLIDNAFTSKGLSPGTLTTLLSGTNAGKSMALLNIGYHAALAKKRIVSIHHEDEEGPTVLRLISRITKIPFFSLYSGKLTDVERGLVASAKNWLKDKWHMKFMYGAETNVEDVANWLKLHKKQFPFDLVIDDYGQFIRTNTKTEGERFTQALVYRALKAAALELKVAMLTCAQSNREGHKVSRKEAEILTMTDFAECFEIARVSDNVITLNRSQRMEKNGELVYSLEKNRNGIVGVRVKCSTDYSRCMTHEAGKMNSVDDFSLPALSDDKKDE